MAKDTKKKDDKSSSVPHRLGLSQSLIDAVKHIIGSDLDKDGDKDDKKKSKKPAKKGDSKKSDKPAPKPTEDSAAPAPQKKKKKTVSDKGKKKVNLSGSKDSVKVSVKEELTEAKILKTSSGHYIVHDGKGHYYDDQGSKIHNSAFVHSSDYNRVLHKNINDAKRLVKRVSGIKKEETEIQEAKKIYNVSIGGKNHKVVASTMAGAIKSGSAKAGIHPAEFNNVKEPAVATEEAENIQELSKKTLGSYYAKSAAQMMFGKNKKKLDSKKYSNRLKGFYQSSSKLAKEETEINEPLKGGELCDPHDSKAKKIPARKADKDGGETSPVMQGSSKIRESFADFLHRELEKHSYENNELTDEAEETTISFAEQLRERTGLSEMKLGHTSEGGHIEHIHLTPAKMKKYGIPSHTSPGDYGQRVILHHPKHGAVSVYQSDYAPNHAKPHVVSVRSFSRGYQSHKTPEQVKDVANHLASGGKALNHLGK